MKKRTKIIGSVLLVLALLGGMAVGLGVWVYRGFIDFRSNFPTQLEAGPQLHEAKRMFSMGPSGINNAFVVYALPDKVSAKIAAEGPEFLDSLPMSLAQKIQSGPRKNKNLTWEPFDKWKATPVPQEKQWLRARIRGHREYEKPWEPSILNFHGEKPDSEFILLIDPEFAGQFLEAIQSPGSFYSYGANRGDCGLVVSPSQGRIYYLYRG